MSVKAYIKNPKYGTGDEPEFLQVPFRGGKQLESINAQLLDLSTNKADKSELSSYVSEEKLMNKNFITSEIFNSSLSNKQDKGDYVTNESLNLSISDMLTKTEASSLYQPKGSYVTSPTLNLYLTKTEANDTFASLSSISDMLTKTEASSTYQVKGDYASLSDLDNKSDKILVEDGGSGEINISIDPNKFYKFGVCTSLSITLNPVTNSEILNIYAFQFTTNDTPPSSIGLPEEIKWNGGESPEIEPNKMYQVTIMNNIAAIGGA